jgi:gliding motility-associated-like protein
MKNHLFFVWAIFLIMGLNPLFSQNISVQYELPEALYVCGTDNTSITLTNFGATTIGNVKVQVEMPSGIWYEPNSIVNAVEDNILNPTAPRFGLGNLSPGESKTISLNVKAKCQVVAALNSGQLFSNNLHIEWSGGEIDVPTEPYPIETALLILDEISPAATSGVKDEVILRTIQVRNTRQGAIDELILYDSHGIGISINVQGVGGQNVNDQYFEATIPGTYFTAFGDGDEFFEYNETITLVEEVTITGCKTEPYTNYSNILLGWSCEGEICQGVSDLVRIQILPSPTNPKLEITSKYNTPFNLCGTEPTPQELLISNIGNLTATDITAVLVSNNNLIGAINNQSIQYSLNGSTVDLIPGNAVPSMLDCTTPNLSSLVVVELPSIEPGDTLHLYFDAYFCDESCSENKYEFGGYLEYPRYCPPGDVDVVNIEMGLTSEEEEFESSVYFDIGACLIDGESYPVQYWLKEERLDSDTGFVQVQMELAWGVFLDTSCVPNLEGLSPISWYVDTMPGVSTTLHMLYETPFAKDSLGGELCMINICQDTTVYIPDIPTQPGPGETFTVTPVELGFCSPCIVRVNTTTILSKTPDASAACGYTYCDEFRFVVDCGCDDLSNSISNGNGNQGTNMEYAKIETYRENLGLRDADDNRIPDNGSTASGPQLRRDRFIVGDTMVTRLHAYAIDTSLGFSFKVFTEVWESDFGVNGGDFFDINTSPTEFTNADSIQLLDISVLVYTAADGHYYECLLEADTTIDELRFNIAKPNIRPPELIDIVASMSSEAIIDFFDLYVAGCIPKEVLEMGDSAIVTIRHKFTYNYTPLPSLDPSLVNFRRTICDRSNFYAWHLGYCEESELLQFSGFKDRFTFPINTIQPCQAAIENSPFSYAISLARSNMFPFEVRPLSKLVEYRYQQAPWFVPYLGSNIKKLAMFGAPATILDQPITPDGTLGDTLIFNLQNLFEVPLDEGYELQISSAYGPSCNFVQMTDSYLFGEVEYVDSCFSAPPVKIFEYSVPSGFKRNRPELELQRSDSILLLPGIQLSTEFALANNGEIASFNTWIQVLAPGLEDIQVLQMPDSIPLQQQGTYFLVDDIAKLTADTFRLLGTYRGCDTLPIVIHYGWNCDPVSGVNDVECGQSARKFALWPVDPEMELVVIRQPNLVSMCTESDTFEFEVYNATVGLAFGVQASLKLPIGMAVVPGSSQISYPSGTAYMDIPEPESLSGNVYLWRPELYFPALIQDGLAGFNNQPENAFKIRFRAIPQCGFVSHTVGIYGTVAEKACGRRSNTLRKPGKKIKLEGLIPDYSVSSSLVLIGTADCGERLNLKAKLHINGVPQPGDSIFIVLPDGMNYLPGTYLPGFNAPISEPELKPNILQWAMPLGLPVGSVMEFSFGLAFEGADNCADQTILLQTRQPRSVFCPTINAFCDVYVATGESFLILDAPRPQLALAGTQLAYQNGALSLSGSLVNSGAGKSPTPTFMVFADLNMNGAMDPSDSLIYTFNSPVELEDGESVPFFANLDISLDLLCNLYAFIPTAPNCTCEELLIPLNTAPELIHPIGICLPSQVNLDIDETPGSVYNWQFDPQLSCLNCSDNVFNPDSTVIVGSVVYLYLEEQSAGCEITHVFRLQFGGEFGLESEDITICEGEPAELHATPGGVNLWTGPGISDPSAPVQIVYPSTTTSYGLTITFQGGCTQSGSILVTVLQKDSTDLGTLQTCVGEPLLIFGELTDVPGVYCIAHTNVLGCDSIVYVELFVQPDQTEEERLLCLGDTLILFEDLIVDKAGTYCSSFISTLGCDSTHCFQVIESQPPESGVQDTLIVVQGSTVELAGPIGSYEYSWEPSEPLSCADCPSPAFLADTSIVYVLRYTDSLGCPGELRYPILAFPPCDPSRLDIPNAFTPDGDGVNDVFRVVPFEGFESVQTLEIYNRWGEQVYTQTGGKVAWDGTHAGKPAPSDVYIWLLRVSCDGIQSQRKGDVTLIR